MSKRKEKEMKELQKKEQEIKKLNGNEDTGKTQWRFLLVDDFAHHKLKTIKGEPSATSKVDIIRELINKEGFSVEIDEFKENKPIFENKCRKNADIYIVWVETVDMGLKVIKKFSFDIILLDYLLGYSEESQKRDYSFDLLRKLKETYKKGDPEVRPMGKFSIMHISAFTTAIAERLQEQGWLRRENIWEISKNACPTNTPQLFLFYLFRLMNRKMEEGLILNVNGILKEIYEKPTLARQQAIKNFYRILEYANKHRMLKDELLEGQYREKEMAFKGKGSVLVNSIYEDNSAFSEHLMHLVYLTAYGTIRQWNEMWEEYLFIRDLIGDYTVKKDGKDKFLADYIEEYIIKLKNNSMI